MKKILRTKLTYNCYKGEDFDYDKKQFITTYDRSFDMFVTASTKEDCEKIMDSFMGAISDANIQSSFDSNLEPEFDENKNVWIGAVEVYVGNELISEEKENIKEVYKEWKEQLKKAPAPEAEEEKNNVENLISEIKTLSSGTVLSIARESGLEISGNLSEVEALEEEWIEFVENTKDNSDNWKQSWKKFAKHKGDMLEAWLNDEEIEQEVLECEAVGGKKCDECKFDKCNKETFELVLSKIKHKNDNKKDMTITDNYKKEDVIELANEGGFLPSYGDFYKKYSSNGTHIKEWLESRGFVVIKNYMDSGCSVAITDCGISVSSNGYCSIHKCIFELVNTDTDIQQLYDRDVITVTNMYKCIECGKVHYQEEKKETYYNEEDWR